MNNKRQLLKGLSAAPLWSLPVVSTIVLPLHAQASTVVNTTNMPTGSLVADANISTGQCPTGLGDDSRAYIIDDETDPSNPQLISLNMSPSGVTERNIFTVAVFSDSFERPAPLIDFEVNIFETTSENIIFSQLVSWDCAEEGYLVDTSGAQSAQMKSSSGATYTASWNLSVNSSGPQGVEFNNLVFTPN